MVETMRAQQHDAAAAAAEAQAHAVQQLRHELSEAQSALELSHAQSAELRSLLRDSAAAADAGKAHTAGLQFSTEAAQKEALILAARLATAEARAEAAEEVRL